VAITDASISQGHARSTAHFPELVLNNFVTRLGHTVGRMFQTMFPPMPQFQGRQVVTLHNQRDFLFFRRHRLVSLHALVMRLIQGCQVCLPIDGEGCVARDRTSVYLEAKVAENRITCREGIRGTLNEIRIRRV